MSVRVTQLAIWMVRTVSVHRVPGGRVTCHHQMALTYYVRVKEKRVKRGTMCHDMYTLCQPCVMFTFTVDNRQTRTLSTFIESHPLRANPFW